MDLISSKIIYPKWKDFRETFFHHFVGLIGLVSLLIVGRVVGSIAIVMLVAETSTLFLNNMYFLRLLELRDSYPRLNTINGLLLIIFFCISRVIFFGVLLVGYIIPIMFSYNYEWLSQRVPWWKIHYAQSLIVAFIGFYVLQVFWFYKLIVGFRKAQAKQKVRN